MLCAELKAVGGRHDGKLIPLEKDRKFLIGREQDCHLRPNGESVSRHHCCFTLDEYCLRLRDLGSTNGTLLNGTAITGQVQLSQGDRVTVGPLEFEILLRESEDETAEEEAPATAEISNEPTDAVESSDVLDDELGKEEPGSGETMIDLPVTDVVETLETAADTAMLSGDTTVIPNEQQQQQLQQQQQQQQQQLQQQLAMQQQMAVQQQQQQQMAMQQHMAMQQQLAMQQQMPFVQQPGMMPGMMPPGFAPQVPQAPVEMPAAQPEVPPAAPTDGVPDVTLPDPATTGAKDPEPVVKPDNATEGDETPSAEENPSNMAEDIIKQYMHRRPSTGS